MDALIWVAIGVVVVMGVGTLAVIASWSPPRAEPPKREAWRDVEVTYAAARAALPKHIRDSFHPDWPWLDPADTPKWEPDPLTVEIAELAGGDAKWTQP